MMPYEVLEYRRLRELEFLVICHQVDLLAIRCIKGHEIKEGNISIRKGVKRCKICMAEAQKKWNEKRKKRQSVSDIMDRSSSTGN